MSQTYFYRGYGIINIGEFLNQETQEEMWDGRDLYEMIDEIECNKCSICCCYGDKIEDTVYIAMNYAWEEPTFKTADECDQYIYEKIKHLLKEDVLFEDLEFAEFCDYEIA